MPSKLVITRDFDAPRDLVWRAWTDPEQLAHWWGPKEMPTSVERFDLRPGGTFLYKMKRPEGDWWGKLVYREVRAPEKLVFVSSFSNPKAEVTRAPFWEKWPLEIESTVTMTEQQGRTTVKLVARPVTKDPDELDFFGSVLDNVRTGYGGTFDQLTRHLADCAGRSILIVRTLDAPIDLVWEAWTNPKHADQWWGPNGFTNQTHAHELKVGGVWRYTMVGPDGTAFPNRQEYLVIEKPTRLVYKHGDDKNHEMFRASVTFTPMEGKTRVSLYTMFPTKEARDTVVEKYGAIEGGKQHLANLGDYLKGMVQGR